MLLWAVLARFRDVGATLVVAAGDAGEGGR
jgi:hypothetical protein